MLGRGDGAAATWPLPPHHVTRPHLVERLLTATGPVALVAGGGYGKTTLAAEVARSYAGPVLLVRLAEAGTGLSTLQRLLARGGQRAGLSDLARLLLAGSDPDEVLDDLHRVLASTRPPILLVLDEVQHLDGGAARWLCSLVDPAPTGLRFLLLGRDLPAGLVELHRSGLLEVWPADDLGFGVDEVRRCATTRGVGLEERAAADLTVRSGGWPALVALTLSDPTTDVGRVPPEAGLGALVGRHLATLDRTDQSALVQAARLPLLHPLVDRALGATGLLERARTAGLPVVSGADLRWRFADPVAEHLRSLAPADPAVAGPVAAAYTELGAPVLAARLLLAHGDHEGAARLVTGWGPEVTESSEVEDVVALVDALPEPVVSRHPRVLLVAAWAHRRLGHPLRAMLALERARDVRALDPEVDRAITAEWAWARSTDEDFEAAVVAAQQVLVDASDGEVATRSRALAALGVALARRPRHGSSVAARQASEAAVQLFLDQGQAEFAAETLLYLGYHQLFQEGLAVEAEAVLQRALCLVPGRSRLRARLSVFLAEVRLGTGDHPGARLMLDEADYLAGTVGNREIIAFVAWLRMELASREGDRDAVLARIADVHAARGEWWDRTGGGAFFLCEAAIAAARVDLDVARAQQESLRAHPARIPILEQLAAAAVTARAGPPAEALAALATDRLGELPQRLLWWTAAMRAAAHHLAGEHERSRAELALMDREARAIGGPELPIAVEGSLLASLRPQGSTGTGPPSHTIDVRALGGFSVRTEDRTLDLPPGHLTRLVQLLAAGGSTRVDVVADLLWPDAELEVGRRRLRNVLLRLRAACPGLVERRGELVAWGPEVQLDVDGFLTTASAALDVRGADPGLARAAVTRYRGHLLPDVDEAEWVAAPRERLRLRVLDLLDLLVDAAIDDDDVDEALRLTHRAIDADPLDDRRYLTAVALLIDKGRHAGARDMLGQAERMRKELGLQPTRAHQAMRERLAGL